MPWTCKWKVLEKMAGFEQRQVQRGIDREARREFYRQFQEVLLGKKPIKRKWADWAALQAGRSAGNLLIGRR